MLPIKYAPIIGPKVSVSDYLKTLSDADLSHMYKQKFFEELKLPDLLTKIKDELLRRGISAATTNS